MANTYTQIYLHVVFAVSGRACVIDPAHREELQKYITGIVTRKGQKLLAIYCMPDHTHVLLGLKPNIAPSDLIGDIKTGSTNHINEQEWIGCRFSWQALAQNKKIWPPPPKYPLEKASFFRWRSNLFCFCRALLFYGGSHRDGGAACVARGAGAYIGHI